MDRRTFVVTSGASLTLLAGCLAMGESSSSDDTDDTDPEQEKYAANDRIEGLENIPLEQEVQVREGEGITSPDAPLRLDVTLTNTADTTVTYAERRAALFWGARSENGFLFVPDDAGDGEPRYTYDDEAEYWVLESGFVMDDDYQHGELDPGETHEETLVLLVDDREDPPADLPEEITFETAFEVAVDEPEDTDLDWGFTLADENEGYVARGDDTDGAFPLEYAVDLTRSDLQASDTPMQVEVSLTNVSDDEIRYGERRTALFWSAQTEAFVLYPEDHVEDTIYERDADSGLWVATDGLAMTMDYQTDTLEPGETHEETLYVLANPEVDVPEPPEELAFETAVSIKDEVPLTAETSVEWRVVLEEETE